MKQPAVRADSGIPENEPTGLMAKGQFISAITPKA